MDDRVPFAHAGTLRLVGELHDQNPVLGHQAHERDQADLGVDVEARYQVDEDQRAEQRHRHRHQDDDRIAQAVELRREREEHDDDREHQRAGEAAGFLHELT